jgi:hypothetical protein
MLTIALLTKSRNRNLLLVISLYPITSLVGPPIGAFILLRCPFAALGLGVILMLLAYPVIMGLRDNSPAVNYKGYRPVTAHDANEREDDTVSVPSREGTSFDTSPSRVAISTSRIRDLENKIKDELVDFFLMFSNSKLSLTFVSILFYWGRFQRHHTTTCFDHATLVIGQSKSFPPYVCILALTPSGLESPCATCCS